jgi:hypothetical protein
MSKTLSAWTVETDHAPERSGYGTSRNLGEEHLELCGVRHAW